MDRPRSLRCLYRSENIAVADPYPPAAVLFGPGELGPGRPFWRVGHRAGQGWGAPLVWQRLGDHVGCGPAQRPCVVDLPEHRRRGVLVREAGYLGNDLVLVIEDWRELLARLAPGKGDPLSCWWDDAHHDVLAGHLKYGGAPAGHILARVSGSVQQERPAGCLGQHAQPNPAGLAFPLLVRYQTTVGGADDQDLGAVLRDPVQDRQVPNLGGHLGSSTAVRQGALAGSDVKAWCR
ncbi:hypothetical protein [Ornithinimicrobium kibberense]|uniref:hypothetical protein n=1 Tax=Ornithinimicrobium kibberense TaxID=282060 RepID=UPI00362148B7